MSGTDVRRQALREMAKEKARIYGEQSTPFQPPKQVASDRAGQESGKGEFQRNEGIPEEGSYTKEMPFEQLSPDRFDEIRTTTPEPFTWEQYSPWRKEGDKKRVKPPNTVTIWCMARKMIAEEWRRALGRPKRDPRMEGLRQEAAMWEERQEQEKKTQEEARQKFAKLKRNLDELLRDIGQRMIEEKNNMTLEKANKLIEDVLGAVGKVYDVQWKSDGCDIWIEPWEQRWPRQKRGEPLPVLYNLRINEQLELDSCDLVEDEKIIASQKEKMLERELSSSREEEESMGKDDEEIRQALNKKLEKIGRVVELKELQDKGWIAVVEPWEEMKIRNIERKGEGPIVTECVVAKVLNGKLVVASLKGDNSIK